VALLTSNELSVKGVGRSRTVFISVTVSALAIQAISVSDVAIANGSCSFSSSLKPRINNKPHYLTAQVEGGRRHFKKFEAALNKIGVLPSGYYTTPASGADIDSYGNMQKGQIIQIMSFFAAFGEHGYTANMTDERRKKLWKGTKKRGGIAYFAVQPGGQGGLKPGIYKRIHSGFGNAIKPVLLFNRAVSYREKLNLQEVANATYDRHFMDKFSQNLTAALNTAIPKR